MVLAVRARSWMVLVSGLLAFGVLGCDGGLSQEEATARCDQEQEARDACFDEDSYASCLAAFTDCGNDAYVVDSCPTDYVCGNTSEEPAQE